VGRIGGRFSAGLGIDVDGGGGEIDRWALAATFFGARISAATAERTYRTFARGGLTSLSEAGAQSFEALVALLDEGGYTRYDFRTAGRLQALGRALDDRYSGTILSFGEIADPAELEQALAALPGWGPVTVALFLRELRGTWPAADPPVDDKALRAAEHLGLLRRSDRRNPRAWLGRLADQAQVDRRDLEASLVRLSLVHGRGLAACPGGARCVLLEPHSDRAGRPIATR
jgi:endonuclease III